MYSDNTNRNKQSFHVRIDINLSRSWTLFNNFCSYSYQRFQNPLESLCFSPWFPIHFCNPFLRVSASHLFRYNPLSKQEINVAGKCGEGEVFYNTQIKSQPVSLCLRTGKVKKLVWWCRNLSLSYCLYHFQSTSLTVYPETLIFALFFFSP